MPSLSIVIPAYNEESRLPKTLDKIMRWAANRNEEAIDIIVVDDGSKDRTAQAAASSAKGYPCFEVLQYGGNRGKGFAVRYGMLHAKGDWILYSDADLSAPIEEFDRLYSEANQAGAPVAIGSRALDRSLLDKHQRAMREWSGRFFNLVMRKTTGLPFRDTQCGFKLFRKDAAQAIFSRQKLDGFSFDVEDVYIAAKLGIKVVEVPVRWSNVEGTKVSLRSGIQSFRDLLEIKRLHHEQS